MNINLNHDSYTVNMELTKEELKDLQYMLTLSFSRLLDDKIFCSSYQHQSRECNRRCESNLDWREKISDLFESIYGDESDG